MSKSKDETKRRINFVLDLTKPREKALADYLDNQFSITGTVKEAIEEKMLRASGRFIEVAHETKEIIEEKQEEKIPELEDSGSLMDFG